MEVFDSVRTVLAVRSYQDKPVPPEVVTRIVEAGRLTASSMNGQPWHFVVVENRDMLRRLAVAARTGPYIAQAPLAIVVVIEKTRFAVSDGKPRDPIDDLDGVVGRGRLELGGLCGHARDQCALGYSGHSRCAGCLAVWLSGASGWTGQKAAQTAL